MGRIFYEMDSGWGVFVCDKEVFVHESKWHARAVAVLKTAHNLALGNTVPHVYVLYDSLTIYSSRNCKTCSSSLCQTMWESCSVNK